MVFSDRARSRALSQSLLQPASESASESARQRRGNTFPCCLARRPGDPPNMTPDRLQDIALLVIPVIIAITFHEAAHGYARESDLRLAVADATRPAILVGYAVGIDLTRQGYLRIIAAREKSPSLPNGTSRIRK